MKHKRLHKYKFQRGINDSFIKSITEHRAIAPQTTPVSTYRQGEYEIRVFSAGHAEGSLKPSGKARMPEMEV